MKALKKSAVLQRRERARLAELLLEVSNRIAVAATLSEAFDVLAQFTASTVNVEQASIFLNDSRTGELYTRIATSKITREIRMLNQVGIAGHVFTTGRGATTKGLGTRVSGESSGTSGSCPCARHRRTSRPSPC